ncbi:hypothetical protein CC2G_006535 [Coprinopsis cinerea AmutBmut pab1-1]|nr:hypothetical protein CC2G_006535 [Coprinopsis cinerea AmutBmut pab1-1]
MPSFVSVYEDTSPYLEYRSEWNIGFSHDENFASYSDGTFTVGHRSDSTMTLRFYGSAVRIYGAHRPFHGTFRVEVDGQEFVSGNGRTPSGVRNFNVTLIDAVLEHGQHEVTLINGDGLVDVDTVSWETRIGEDDEPLIVNTIEDSRFVYQPEGAWTTTPLGYSSFLGRSGHGTTQLGATAELTFEGDCIALFGSVGPNSTSSYSVELNGGEKRSFSAQQRARRTKQLMYWAGGLGSGNHTLRVTMESSRPEQELAIDYAEVYTTPSLGGRFEEAAAIVAAAPTVTVTQRVLVSDTPIAKVEGLPSGVIAGLAVVSVVAALAIICAAVSTFLLLRSRRRPPPDAQTAAIDPLLPPHMTYTNADANSGVFVQGGSSRQTPDQPPSMLPFYRKVREGQRSESSASSSSGAGNWSSDALVQATNRRLTEAPPLYQATV